MIEAIFFDLDKTLLKSSEATTNLFESITKYFSIDISGIELKALFKGKALLSLKELSQFNYIEKINSGYTDLFYIDLKSSILREIEVENYKLKVSREIIKSLDTYNSSLTEKALISYLKENWIKHYKTYNSTHKVLKELSSKYRLYIMTNGFEEIQKRKIDFCNIGDYFQSIIVSSQLGIGKPSKEIYNYGLKVAKTNPKKSIMIGDNINNDIVGADKVGMGTIFIKRNKDILKNINLLNDSKQVNKLEDIIKIIDLWDKNGGEVL